MIDFLLNLLRALPVVTALLIVAAVNTRRSHRVQQTWLPLIAITYALVALILLYQFNDSIDASLQTVSNALPLPTPQWSATSRYLLENVLALLVFAAIKFVVRPVFGRFFRGGREIAQFVAARIYEYDPEYELWFVESRHKKLRDFYRALYWVSMCLGVLLIATAATFPTWPGFSAIAFPAIAVMLIGEFYFAIDGVTHEEYSHSLFGERDSSRRVGNYGPLRRVLRDAFPDRVLGEGIQLASIAPLDSGYRVGEMTRSTDPNVRLAGAYFERLRREGTDVDVNLVGSAATLMSGTSVLFANPFYSDLTPYLALPVYRELLEGRRCLIVAGRDSLAEDLRRWMEEGLESITGVPHLWRVRQLDSASKERIDVGILRAADLHNLEVLGNGDDLFGEVGLLILAEPSRILATGQLGLELVHDRCTREGGVTVAAFDGNHDGLVDTLSHLTKSNLTEVVASPLPQGASSEIIWRADGPHMHTSILPGVTRYLGIGTELSAVALKYQVRRVHWVGGEAFPVIDMRWIAQQYFAPISQFADLEISQDVLAESLVAVPNQWSLPQEDNYFLIVEDEANNAYETVRSFATRARRSGFVNLVSDDYLLRDYMVENRDVFSIDPKAIPAIVPDYARTERNVTLRILLGLSGFGISNSELTKQLELPTWTLPDQQDQSDAAAFTELEPRVIRQLRRSISEHTGIGNADDVPIAVAGTGLLDIPLLEGNDPTYILQPGSKIDDILDALGPAYFFVEDDVDEANVIGSLLLDHVYQALLPGQFVTYGGKYYEVQGITHDGGQSRVILRRAADHIRDRWAYRQLRDYTVSNIRPADQVGATRITGRIELRRVFVDMRVETRGYLECTSRSDLTNARRVRISGVPHRNYRNKAALLINVRGASGDVRRTITLLLNELFLTVFPHSHPYITAVTMDAEGELGDLVPGLVHSQSEFSSEVHLEDSILILEDSMMDLGLASAVERNWERLLEIITDYLMWNSDTGRLNDSESEPLAPVLDPISLFPDRSYAPRKQQGSWLDKAREAVGRLRPSGPRSEDEAQALPPQQVTAPIVAPPVQSEHSTMMEPEPIEGVQVFGLAGSGELAPELESERVGEQIPDLPPEISVESKRAARADDEGVPREPDPEEAGPDE